MFYENRMNIIFKVLISVVYFIIDNYVCTDYLYCPQTKLNVSNKWFENTTYNDISVIGIPELLMNFISYHRFANNTKSAVIL